MSEQPKHATLVKFTSGDVEWTNLVVHDCTCFDFAKEIRDEILRVEREEGLVGKIDLFWHIDNYCREKYGECHWNIVSMDELQHLVFTREEEVERRKRIVETLP